MLLMKKVLSKQSTRKTASNLTLTSSMQNKTEGMMKTGTRMISNFFFSTNSSLIGQGFENQQIHKICLTGGPCAGKTTALTHLQHVLSQKGVRVFTVPEAATLLMKGGAMINTSMYNFDQAVKFQMALMKL